MMQLLIVFMLTEIQSFVSGFKWYQLCFFSIISRW